MGAAVRIRPATVADCGAINAIYNYYVDTSPATFDTKHVSEERRREWFEGRMALALPVLVAEREGSDGITGWCALGRWSPKGAYDTTREESIYIADKHRGKGVGRELLNAIVEEARRCEVQVVMARRGRVPGGEFGPTHLSWLRAERDKPPHGL